MTQILRIEMEAELHHKLQSIASECNRSLDQFVLILLRGYAEKYEYILAYDPTKPQETSEIEVNKTALNEMIESL